MTDEQFRCFLNLMMCSDPWPISDDPVGCQTVLEIYANEESQIRGFSDWIEAYHQFEV